MFKKPLLGIFLLFGCNIFAAKPMTALEVEKWADQLFYPSLEDKRLSGAVVSLVQDGQLQFSKGYGYADLLKKTPMDPETTGFRIGSNSKTFVATAIAQLIDKGLIKSLDDPANRYLKRIQLPANDNVEITIRHLITHSTGYENQVFHIGFNEKIDLPLSTEIIESYLPEFVNPAGKYSSYNNFGTAMLGIIVEDITGLLIADYLKQYIFDPLNMNSTYLNMSPDVDAKLGVPYGFAPNGEPVAFPHRQVHPFYSVVGGVNSTSNDMAKYMFAHLDEGRTATNPLMSEQAFKLLHTQIRTNHPLSSGFGMIFFTWQWNDTKMYLHGGNWPGSQSGMIMFPESNTALFFGLQSGDAEIPVMESLFGSERLQPIEGITVERPLSNVGVISHFANDFLGAYVPPVAGDFIATDSIDYVGYYQPQSTAYSTFERALSILGNDHISVEESTLGGLKINDVEPFKEISEGVFYKEGYKTPLSDYFNKSPIYNFVRDKNGNVEYVTTQVGFDAWVKIDTIETPEFYASIWGLCLIICLTGLLFIVIKSQIQTPFAKWTPPIIAILLIAMPLSVISGYSEGDSILSYIFNGYKFRFIIFVIMANLVAVLSILSLFYTVRVWSNQSWGTGVKALLIRIFYTLLTLAAMALIPVFHFINALIV